MYCLSNDISEKRFQMIHNSWLLWQNLVSTFSSQLARLITELEKHADSAFPRQQLSSHNLVIPVSLQGRGVRGSPPVEISVLPTIGCYVAQFAASASNGVNLH